MPTLTTSYRVILYSLVAMIIASVLMYFDTGLMLAYALLVIGFFGIGIGILMGFYKMIHEDESEQ